MGRPSVTHGREEECIKSFGGKVKKEQLGRSRRRWKDNVKMDLREKGRRGMDWINMAEDRNQYQPLMNSAMNLWTP
jgi:hypothetical protein